VPKGWGFEKWIVNKEQYCGKLLYIVKDKRCSWHYHKLKVLYSDDNDINTAKSVILSQGDNFHVPVGLRHQMIAIQDTEMFEFSTQHFDEDSYRIIKGD